MTNFPLETSRMRKCTMKNLVQSFSSLAGAEYIEALKEIRVDKMIEGLLENNTNRDAALQQFTDVQNWIFELQKQAKIRGGPKGAHGFIAERMEVAYENACRLEAGDTLNAIWINNNGPADIQIQDQVYQLKFVQYRKGLKAIEDHMDRYKDYVSGGGKYKIPKDYYDDLVRIKNSPSSAVSGEEAKLQRIIAEFEQKTGMKVENLEPSQYNYADVQMDNAVEVLEKDKQNVQDRADERAKRLEEKGKASVREAMCAVAISIALEAAVSGFSSIVTKVRSGKKLSEFTAKDWKEVGLDMAGGGGKGGVRGASVYALVNFCDAPAPMAAAYVSAAVGMGELAVDYRKGAISGDEFVAESEMLCIETGLNIIATTMGQVLIPIPFLGALIGQTAASVAMSIAKSYLNEQEQQLIYEQQKELEQVRFEVQQVTKEFRELVKARRSYLNNLEELVFNVSTPPLVAWNAAYERATLFGASDAWNPKDRAEGINFFTK